jgi:23S rRNA maturation mini-RNase III
MSPNHGTPRSLRKPRDFHESVENIIEQKKRTNHIHTRIDEKLEERNEEKFIIARVTNGNSTLGNSDAIENIHGNIPTKRTIIATKATINNTIG